MEPDSSTITTLFDELLQSREIQMIKSVIPYFDQTKQRTLSIYIKFLELQNTIDFFNDEEESVKMCSVNETQPSPLELLNTLRNYCTSKEIETLDSFTNLLNTMQMVQTFSALSGNDKEENGGPMDLMKNFLSPEQQSMFETYSAMF